METQTKNILVIDQYSDEFGKFKVLYDGVNITDSVLELKFADVILEHIVK